MLSSRAIAPRDASWTTSADGATRVKKPGLPDLAALVRTPRGRTGLIAFLVVMAVVVKCAWLCDDAFITQRTVDNVLHGRGLTWNPGERVQAYTHPLWLAVLVVADVVAPGGTASILLASLATTAVAVGLLLRGLPGRAPVVVAAAAALVLSRAQVDFATSGLENPLAALLLVLALRATLPRADEAAAARGDGLPRLVLLASLVALTRLDLLLVAAPVLAAGLWARRGAGVRRLLAAASPLLAWEAFSVVYYGFPLPNTAYAKLGTGIPAADLVRQGLWYLEATLRRDPGTLVVIVGGLVLAAWRGDRTRRLWAAGVALYLAYVVRVGGDFMLGRFLAVPLVVVVALCADLLPGGRRGWIIAGVLGCAALVPGGPLLSSTPKQAPWFHGVADERAYYFPNTGLVPRLRPGFVEHEHVLAGRQARAITEQKGAAFQVFDSIGFYGYYAGPRLHIIDALALSDPFLARLPVPTPRDPRSWRIGHFKRALPEGYRETIADGRNVIADPALARMYEDVRLVTTGGLFDGRRWGAIWRLNVGGAPGR